MAAISAVVVDTGVMEYRSNDDDVAWYVDVGPYQLLYGSLRLVTHLTPWLEAQVVREVLVGTWSGKYLAERQQAQRMQ